MSRYSLRDLAKTAGTSPYVIRHYVKGGLLHPATRAGQASVFDDSHVVALGVITSLRAAGHRGRALRTRIPEEIARVTAPPPVAPTLEPPPPEAPAFPTTRRPSARDAVDAAVCAAAEQLDVSPRGLRAALAVVLRRLHEAGVSPEEASLLVVRPGTEG